MIGITEKRKEKKWRCVLRATKKGKHCAVIRRKKRRHSCKLLLALIYLRWFTTCLTLSSDRPYGRERTRKRGLGSWLWTTQQLFKWGFFFFFQLNCSQVCLIPKHARGSEVFTRNGLDQVSVLYIKLCHKDFSFIAPFDFLAPAWALKATCGRMTGANRWSR